MQIPRYIPFIGLFAMLGLPALAQNAPPHVEQILPDGDMRLSDQTTLHLRGVHIVDVAGAVALLAKEAAGKDIVLQNPSTDRYGRNEADAVASGMGLADELVKQGLAFVYATTDISTPHLAALMKDEQEVRKSKRGIWGDVTFAGIVGDVPADDADGAIGRYAFVRGVVVDVAQVKNMYYINFGADWRSDFTIAITAKNARIFEKANIDIMDYKGKTIRVRGWVKRKGGAMIEATSPTQIEILKAD